MKRFRFRLQKVLEYRERVRDEKKEVLQRRNYERDAAIEKLNALRQEQLNAAITNNMETASQLMLLAEYRIRLSHEIELQIKKVEEATAIAEEARLDYVESERDAKALDTLKTKRQSEYDEAAQKQELEMMDELTVQRAARKGL